MRIRRQVDLNLEAEFNIRVSQRVIKANVGPIVISGCYRRRSSKRFFLSRDDDLEGVAGLPVEPMAIRCISAC